MKTDDIKKMAEAYLQVLEGKKKPMLDPVGQADADIDNDGDVDNSDEYLHTRRKAIRKAMNKEDKDLDTDNVDKALRHDCASHVTHESYGEGVCVPGQHTIVETSEGEGYVTHYDVMFGEQLVQDVPVEELTIVSESSHMHTRKKKMKKESVEQIDELSSDALRTYKSLARNRLRKLNKKIDNKTATDKEKYRAIGYEHGLDTATKKLANRQESVEQIDEAKTSIRVDIPYFDDEPARAKAVQRKHRVKVTDKGRDYQITGDKKNIIKFLMDKDALEWDKDEIEDEFPELFESVDEAKVPSNYAAMMAKKRKKAGTSEFGKHPDSKPPFPGPYKKASADGSSQDEYGNTIKLKNRAKHLAKMGMKQEDAEHFSDYELEMLASVYEAKDREMHYKGATKPEDIMDKESPKSKEFAAKHKYGGDTSASETNFDEKGHDDATKAGRVTKAAPARRADKLDGRETMQKPVDTTKKGQGS